MNRDVSIALITQDGFGNKHQLVVTNDRFGRELFGLFMLAAFALIAVEMVLSRKA